MSSDSITGSQAVAEKFGAAPSPEAPQAPQRVADLVVAAATRLPEAAALIVTADRVPLSAQTGPLALFGYGAHPADNRVQIPFDWPVGILDAEVTITWTWHDAAGDWDGAWRGHIRVPHPEMPDELGGGSGASGPFVEDTGGPAHQATGDARADAPPIAGESRVDPLSHIRGGTAKQARHPEPGQ